MPTKDPVNWMLSEAIESLARAERLHQRLFSLQPGGTREVNWEPPIDVLETDRELLIFVALPGVDPDQVVAIIENGVLIIKGHRILPAELRDALIHRLELPQGGFERRIALPAGRYGVSRTASNGCVVLRLSKAV
ncbi:Hsp20/alpha crystallin family protein [Bradyrhizobium sp. Leo121]|jgi:HSP20 family molecular chaperone IbpA|uniref:Hsp20/alpha crystallin family protein n=1 Tax=Bradyrhizobium sp. Leo121 TaxID=1571195 RepID=UPI00102992A8|nr:Hsp20/alpha crystallin family protein [Bradyrhizobium sp. Leo121]RZN30270.1 heat-shock protein Hsp20 [Bradyrhizobium sp. Leo121]